MSIKVRFQHAQLQKIPKVGSRLYSAKVQEYDDSYFDSIECCLAKYEHLQEVAPILELALLRANINVQSNSRFSNIERNRCRVNIFFVVAIIPFL